MPYINMKTSAKLDTGAIKELKNAFGTAITAIPGKSEKWLMLSFDGGCQMAFGGDMDTDCAMLEVEIFGTATDADFDSLTEKLCTAVTRITGIPSDRIYVKYAEVQHWGHNGYNF